MSGDLHEEFDSSSDVAGLAGERLDIWLNDLGWPRNEIDRLLRAVAAAIDNACTHAYRDGSGVVDVRARVLSGPAGTHRLSVTISDRGVWSDPVPGTSGGGTPRGLAAMRANVAHLRLDGNAAGTRVHMISSPVRLQTYALR